MKNYILEEMNKLGADGVEFVSIGTDFTKPYIPIAIMSRSQLEQSKLFPKSNRRYYKIVDGRRVYCDDIEQIDDERDGNPTIQEFYDKCKEEGLLDFTIDLDIEKLNSKDVPIMILKNGDKQVKLMFCKPE